MEIWAQGHGSSGASQLLKRSTIFQSGRWLTQEDSNRDIWNKRLSSGCTVAGCCAPARAAGLDPSSKGHKCGRKVGLRLVRQSLLGGVFQGKTHVQ